MKTTQGIVVKSDSCIIYRNSKGKQLTKKQMEALSQSWRRVDYNGYISKSTRSKIINMLTAWADSINVYNRYGCNSEMKRKRKLRFLTLTLSEEQNILDLEIKRKALMPYIQMLQKQCGLEQFFWRAEAQKNGNIHFHLIIDCYISKSKANYLWDLAQYNAGLLKEKPQKTETYHSSSTRIEAVQGVKAVAGYVIKYVTKEDGSRKIFGRVWGCSKGLKKVSVPAMEFSNEIAKEVTAISAQNKYEVYQTDFFIIHYTSVLYDVIWEKSQFRLLLETYFMGQYESIYNTSE